MMTYFHGPKGLLTRMVGGLLLIVVGFLLLPGGKQPTPSTESQVITDTTVSQSNGWRLAYDQEEGKWLATPMGGAPFVLTDIVPGPKKSLPRGYLKPTEIREVLLSAIDAWSIQLSETELQELTELKLDGQAIFRATDLKRTKQMAPAATESEPELVTAQSEDEPDPIPEPAEKTAATWEPRLPASLNPIAAIFKANMASWRQALLPLLNKVKRQRGQININLPSATGKHLRIPTSEEVRQQIRSGRFGQRAQDAALFMQFLALERGADIALDGAFGPGSRNIWQDLLIRDGHDPQLVDQYLDWLADCFGNGIPDTVNPNWPEFPTKMRAWRDWVVPRLNDGGYSTTFTGEGRTLQISAAARGRILADDFGKRRKDEIIYLQFLANHYGETLTIDGNLGKQSRSVLISLVTATFRKGDKGDEYRRLLAARYPNS